MTYAKKPAPYSEFIANGPQLHALTTYSPQSVRQQHSEGRGPLVPILAKLGGRLGIWRQDWDAFAESQRKLPSGAFAEHRVAVRLAQSRENADASQTERALQKSRRRGSS